MASRSSPELSRAPRLDAAEAIMGAAEGLFGRQGIDGVSLREIAVAAGQRNISAVQYHFGDKAKLVRAIYARRMPAVERRRAELLSELREQGRASSLPGLVRCLFMPIIELVDEEGRHTYGRFLSQALNSPSWYDFDLGAAAAPVTWLLVGMIAETAGLVDKQIIAQRFVFATLTVTHMLKHWDSFCDATGEDYPRHLFDDALDTAVRIFS